MRALVISAIVATWFIALGGCTPSSSRSEARFEFFRYQGEDSRFNHSFDSAHEYLNPIIAGFYPDPSICRKGEDYYLVNSSFAYYPGIPIFHSRDLVNWEQIGHVLDRPSQLQLDSIRLDGGIYAPAITYNPFNNTFYLVTTCVDGIGNFIVKTQNPHQGWSEPIPLPKVGGIDPSLFFDEDGKGYIVHNDAPPKEPEYDGHRAIWIHQYDTLTDQTQGAPQLLIDGGVDKSTHPVWIEGPHLYKVNGTYYLMAAEGGTGNNHSEVIFTSDRVKGPYKPAAHNPILTQRDLAANRPDCVTSTGHADLIDTPSGEWFAVFLGCRPYKDDLYHTGRETFLLPVSWENGVPMILAAGKAVPTRVKPEGWHSNTQGIQPDAWTGNFTWTDAFESDHLSHKWLFIRTPKEKFWSIDAGKLLLTPTSHSLYTRGSPAFIGHRQQHTNFTVTTRLEFTPQHEGALGGLACYQNERFNIVFGKSLQQDQPVVTVISTTGGNKKEMGTFPLALGKEHVPIYLRIIGRADQYSFALSFDQKEWHPVATNVDSSNLSTQKAGGFTGTVIGMIADN